MSVTKQSLSKLLYELDIANTCCNVNDVFDEYDYEAEKILALSQSLPLCIAIKEVFNETFSMQVPDDALGKMLGLFSKEV